MRIALISDIHGNRWALAAVLDHIARQRVDAIWNLGDILSGPLEPGATADLLAPLALPTIRGNHERQLLACAERPGAPSDQFAFAHTEPRHHDWLRALPATLAPRAPPPPPPRRPLGPRPAGVGPRADARDRRARRPAARHAGRGRGPRRG